VQGVTPKSSMCSRRKGLSCAREGKKRRNMQVVARKSLSRPFSKNLPRRRLIKNLAGVTEEPFAASERENDAHLIRGKGPSTEKRGR